MCFCCRRASWSRARKRQVKGLPGRASLLVKSQQEETLVLRAGTGPEEADSWVGCATEGLLTTPPPVTAAVRCCPVLCMPGRGAGIGACGVGAGGRQDRPDAIHKARPPGGGALRGAFKAAGDAEIFPKQLVEASGLCPLRECAAYIQTEEPRLTGGAGCGHSRTTWEPLNPPWLWKFSARSSEPPSASFSQRSARCLWRPPPLGR